MERWVSDHEDAYEDPLQLDEYDGDYMEPWRDHDDDGWDLLPRTCTETDWDSVGDAVLQQRQHKRKPAKSKRACSGGRGGCDTRRSHLSAWDFRKEERKLASRRALYADTQARGPRSAGVGCRGSLFQAASAPRATYYEHTQQWEQPPARSYARWRAEAAAPRIPRCPENTTQLPQKVFELMHNLQFREIDPNDFDLLMELAEYDSKKTLSEGKLGAIPFFEATTETVEECAEGCVFCAEEYEVGEQLKRLPCGHVFHDHCITGHLSKYSTKCPFNTGVAFGGCTFDFDEEMQAVK
eukprot:TRINITY_DN32721_c0_g1_i2.p1 TRINITY_DN32721_c0_g1~~TRINITY_DN32721_c0_g1_i2.p1  ORF type:complete len:296 (+),score=52.44 TRINITY_DN32721_c0_g1_i2:297-1184(+)